VRVRLVLSILEPAPPVVNEPAPDSIPTRHSLLHRLKDWGDDTGWREFFDTYWELIYHVARKAGLTDTEAQEVVQETVIGVAKKIGGFEVEAGRGSFKAWLLQQARWRIGDQFRKRKAGGREWAGGLEVSGSAHDDATGTATVNRIADPAAPELDGLWDAEWRVHVQQLALHRVKALVSIPQFQMFDLHALQGLSVGETAVALGVSRASVYMAKSRVARLFKAELDRIEAAGK
jgi:RNA polymerase sigma factor (sigma-70 family)